jgi:hypothetical protein
MKKIKLTKNQDKYIRIFFRFLKNNKVFSNFIQDYKKVHGYENFLERFKNKPNNLLSYIVDIIPYYNNEKIKDYWYNIDNKWLIYIYENKLYGKPYTCSKYDLLVSILDIVEVFCDYDEEVTKKAKKICEIENICFYG